MSKKPDLLPIARVIASAGQPLAVIAQVLGVPLRTVQRWAQEEREAGAPWQPQAGFAPPRPGEELLYDYNPAEVLLNLRSRLARLAREAALGGTPDIDIRIGRLTAAIERLEAHTGDLDAHLQAVKGLAEWAMTTMPEGVELNMARKLIRQYLDHLREQNEPA